MRHEFSSYAPTGLRITREQPRQTALAERVVGGHEVQRRVVDRGIRPVQNARQTTGFVNQAMPRVQIRVNQAQIRGP